MAQTRSHALVPQATRPEVATVKPTQELRFPIRILGQSDARIVPQRVGNWWLEPVQEGTPLPPRAKQRLAEFLATGVVPRAIVVFHEIPDTPAPLSTPARLAVRAQHWAQQELPVLVDGAKTQQYAPVLGSWALRAARRAAPIVGIAALTGVAIVGHLAMASTAVVAAAVVDPCLVVVTEDGTWVELDRW